MTRTTMKIDGMSCGHCVMAVRKALEGVDGTNVENVALGTATVEYDPNVTSPQKIAEAINDAGYAVSAAA
ncbi:MAG TPA: heavy-metal-associated domain-containing protein [Gemmatimonadaceae bacterium]